MCRRRLQRLCFLKSFRKVQARSRRLRHQQVRTFVLVFTRNLRFMTRITSLQAYLFEETRVMQSHEDDPVPYRGRLRVVSREKGSLCEACERQLLFYSRPQTGGSTRPQTRDGIFRLSYASEDNVVDPQWRLS